MSCRSRSAMRSARRFIDEFRKKDFDGGLERGVAEIERTLEGVSVGNHRVGARRARPSRSDQAPTAVPLAEAVV